VADGAEGAGDPARPLDLEAVALAVAEAERVRGESLGPGDRQRDRRIEAPAQQHHRRFRHGINPLPWKRQRPGITGPRSSKPGTRDQAA
jgi:hypothetical protein